jgi:hypothetical protein
MSYLTVDGYSKMTLNVQTNSDMERKRMIGIVQYVITIHL